MSSSLRSPMRLSRRAMAALSALATVVAAASWQAQLPDAQAVGHGVFRYSGFRIYDAELWSPTGRWVPAQPYALVLRYHHDIGKARFIDTSIDEMVRSMGGKANAATLAGWRAAMERSFVDIRAGEQMAALFLPGQGVRFFHGDAPTAEIADPAFADAFAGIWQGKACRDPGLRAALLGQAGSNAP